MAAAFRLHDPCRLFASASRERGTTGPRVRSYGPTASASDPMQLTLTDVGLREDSWRGRGRKESPWDGGSESDRERGRGRGWEWRDRVNGCAGEESSGKSSGRGRIPGLQIRKSLTASASALMHLMLRGRGMLIRKDGSSWIEGVKGRHFVRAEEREKKRGGGVGGGGGAGRGERGTAGTGVWLTGAVASAVDGGHISDLQIRKGCLQMVPAGIDSV